MKTIRPYFWRNGNFIAAKNKSAIIRESKRKHCSHSFAPHWQPATHRSQHSHAGDCTKPFENVQWERVFGRKAVNGFLLDFPIYREPLGIPGSQPQKKVAKKPRPITDIPSSDSALPATVEKTVLLKTQNDYAGNKYFYLSGQVEIVVIRLDIPPHTIIPLHRHPAICIGRVISGALTIVCEDISRDYHMGDFIPEVQDTFHWAETQSTPVVLEVFYASVAGMPLAFEA